MSGPAPPSPPSPSSSSEATGLAVASRARRTLQGEGLPAPLSLGSDPGTPASASATAAATPESSSATEPAAHGLAIDVPFISCLDERHQSGTQATAAPGAETTTPVSPSNVGPREDQV